MIQAPKEISVMYCKRVRDHESQRKSGSRYCSLNNGTTTKVILGGFILPTPDLHDKAVCSREERKSIPVSMQWKFMEG